jgi:hypothetical protein
MPAYSQITNPTLYANWNKVYFDDSPTETRVVTYIDPSNSNLRVAWGKTSAGYYFYVKMHSSDESTFWSDHATWRAANPGTHTWQAFSNVPPTCGTPTTPPCP